MNYRSETPDEQQRSIGGDTSQAVVIARIASFATTAQKGTEEVVEKSLSIVRQLRPTTTSVRLTQTVPKSCLRASSSQRKNGPPSSAVMMPTGNSVGAITVRAAVSQITRNAPPNSSVAGYKRR
jgi:hypothetical protein